MAYNNRLTPLAAQMPMSPARSGQGPSSAVETLARRMMQPVPTGHTGPVGQMTTAPSGGAGLPPTPPPPPAPPPVTGNHPGPGGTNRTGPLFAPPPGTTGPPSAGLGHTPPPTGAVTPPTDPSSQALLNEGFTFSAANGPLGTVSTQGYFVPPGETIDQVTGGAPTPGNILGPGGTIVPAGQAGATALQQLLGIGGYGSAPFVTDAAGNPTLPVGWTPATPVPKGAG